MRAAARFYVAVVAVEPDAEMRARARRRAPKARASIEVVGGDAMNLPFPDGSYDREGCRTAANATGASDGPRDAKERPSVQACGGPTRRRSRWWTRVEPPLRAACAAAARNIDALRGLGSRDRDILDVVGLVALNVLTGTFNLVAGLEPEDMAATA